MGRSWEPMLPTSSSARAVSHGAFLESNFTFRLVALTVVRVSSCLVMVQFLWVIEGYVEKRKFILSEDYVLGDICFCSDLAGGRCASLLLGVYL